MLFLSGRHINSSQILQRVWERRLWNFPSQRKQEATISPTYVLFFRRADPLLRQRFTFEIGWDTLLFRFVLFFSSVRITATLILDVFTLSTWTKNKRHGFVNRIFDFVKLYCLKLKILLSLPAYVTKFYAKPKKNGNTICNGRHDPSKIFPSESVQNVCINYIIWHYWWLNPLSALPLPWYTTYG